MTVAITGAAGYLGGRVMRTLQVCAGVDVRGLVRAKVAYLPAVDQVEIDLVDDDDQSLRDALDGVASVVHLAGHDETVFATHPDRALAETVVAAHRVADAARVVGVRRLVHVSTVHVYGSALSPGATVAETSLPTPTSAYAVARLASEHLLSASGAPTVVLRLTNAVGAPVDTAVDRWSLVALDLCRAGVRRGELTLRTPGTQWRDFVALEDVARIVARTAHGETSGPVPPGTYNLASGNPTTIRELALLIQHRFEALEGIRPPLRAPAPEAPVVAPYRVAVDRLAGHGLAARVPLTDAIDELIRFCRLHEDEL